MSEEGHSDFNAIIRDGVEGKRERALRGTRFAKTEQPKAGHEGFNATLRAKAKRQRHRGGVEGRVARRSGTGVGAAAPPDSKFAIIERGPWSADDGPTVEKFSHCAEGSLSWL